ncbi:hypothetical protein KL933_002931 [Ogataea haglerorum]|uniref:DNA repair protein RAD4 n=1 Tax=Ogataea haglerorum TaxID=1937702 RepID=A0AAN6D5G7_9ASCO|nr:hypothetical protein KL933_002931 [Ogataea haglerorum]
MLAEALRESSGSDTGSEGPARPLKRHGGRRGRSGEHEAASDKRAKIEPANDSVIEVSDRSSVSPQPPQTEAASAEAISVDSDEDEYSEFDEDFEDVDLSGTAPDLDRASLSEEITVSISRPTKQTRKQNVVSADERLFRKTLHMLYLFAMVAHGVVRNAWCSSPEVLRVLRGQVPGKLLAEVDAYHEQQQRPDVTSAAKSRRLLDLLRHLMQYWYRSWTVETRHRGLYRKTWEEIAKLWEQPAVQGENVTKAQFVRRMQQRRGSRDLAAQGFVALLRALDINCRLVFSLQPPDFTNLAVLAPSTASGGSSKEASPAPKSSPRRRKAASQHERLLSALRVNRPVYTNFRPEAQDDVQYPVFWCEVWDSASKRFTSVDPIVQRYIENVGTRSRFEWPNNTTYVLAYDRLGGVRDVTRRYSVHFNAKTRKKRITRDPRGQDWYDKLLRGANSWRRLASNKIDQYEQVEFEQRSLKEGMPNSIQDFANHPVYVLEEQLKANEVLKPKISCGTVRKKTKAGKAGELVPVYRRSNVVTVRSAKAWFLRGRVLKIGEQPLKVREQRKQRPDDDDDDDVRLYGEHQTEKYVPPPVVGGKIPRNSYGNIDLYQPWMLPEGTAHVPEKQAEKAAKLLEIDYVPAAVGFEFGSGSRGRGASVSVRIAGVVVLAEHKEAVEAVCEYLREEEEEAARRRREAAALRVWAMVLAKLRISKRLDREHGLVEDSGEDAPSESEHESASEDGPDTAGGFVPEADSGGFLPQDTVAPPTSDSGAGSDSNSADYSDSEGYEFEYSD